MNFTHFDSPIGPLLLAGEDGFVGLIKFPKRGVAAEPDPSWIESTSGVLGDAMRQLTEYFWRQRVAFDLPLAPAGTTFQLAVWKQLQEIPYGATISYRELARRVGNSNASRAVGAANARNPIPIVIPCHRVIGTSGKLIGFAGGLPVKEALLSLERSPAPLT